MLLIKLKIKMNYQYNKSLILFYKNKTICTKKEN